MSQYPLRLPESLMRATKRAAKADKTSINQFIITAIAEKVAALETEAMLGKRAVMADRAAFIKLLDKVSNE
tara:strand:- start:377954 stop:378166 length:213 start_codon:yes stop_codon:yes gene_type:complete